MEGWEAITWVFGGLAGATAIFTTFYNLADKFFTSKNKKQLSLDKNWDVTRDLEDKMGSLAELCSSNTKILNILVLQRNARLNHELAKNESLVKTMEIVSEDKPDLKPFLNNLKKEQAAMEKALMLHQTEIND